MENNHREKEEEEKEMETRKRFRGTRSEEEVEEFFAIIRRMHAATRMMSRRRERPYPEAAVEKKAGIMDWRPTFSLEDFAKVEKDADAGPGKLRSSEEAPATKNNKGIGLGRGGVCLDLNAEPESEGVPG